MLIIYTTTIYKSNPRRKLGHKLCKKVLSLTLKPEKNLKINTLK